MDSIAATSILIAGAEKIWFERSPGIDEPFLTSYFIREKIVLLEIWKNSSNNLKNYIANLAEEDYETEFYFENIAGQQFRAKQCEALAHVFNHSTYHRGQIVNYLKQVGFADVGSTDLINYYRLGIQFKPIQNEL